MKLELIDNSLYVAVTTHFVVPTDKGVTLSPVIETIFSTSYELSSIYRIDLLFLGYFFILYKDIYHTWDDIVMEGYNRYLGLIEEKKQKSTKKK